MNLGIYTLHLLYVGRWRPPLDLETSPLPWERRRVGRAGESAHRGKQSLN
jgi:hypothetical protein